MKQRVVSAEQEQQLQADLMVKVLKICRYTRSVPLGDVNRGVFFELLDGLHTLVKHMFFEGEGVVDDRDFRLSCEMAFQEALQRGDSLALYDAVLDTVVQYDMALKELC
jgi:hypothetical protein